MVRYTMSCGKRRYGSLGASTAALNAIWRYALNGRPNRSAKLPCRSYYCIRCRGYHHTSQPTREAIDERAKSE